VYLLALHLNINIKNISKIYSWVQEEIHESKTLFQFFVYRKHLTFMLTFIKT